MSSVRKAQCYFFFSNLYSFTPSSLSFFLSLVGGGLIILARISITLLGRNHESRHRCFVPILRRNAFNLFIIRYDASYTFFRNACKFPFISSFLRVFTMNMYWILTNAPNEVIRWFFFFSLLMWNKPIYFQVLNQL